VEPGSGGARAPSGYKEKGLIPVRSLLKTEMGVLTPNVGIWYEAPMLSSGRCTYVKHPSKIWVW
jgi:hypothetical protein